MCHSHTTVVHTVCTVHIEMYISNMHAACMCTHTCMGIVYIVYINKRSSISAWHLCVCADLVFTSYVMLFRKNRSARQCKMHPLKLLNWHKYVLQLSTFQLICTTLNWPGRKLLLHC
jgi:hypothetical protein